MSNKTLFVFGLICIVVAGYFYKSGDSSLTNIKLKASDIDYQASNIKALQTDETGNVHYQMTAKGVTHYQKAGSAVLEIPNIVLPNHNNKQITLTADNATFDENSQIAQLTNNVKVVSKSVQNDDTAPIEFTTTQMVGDLKNKKIMSQSVVKVNQQGNTFEAQSMYGDMATGDYQFEKVAMTFLPNN